MNYELTGMSISQSFFMRIDFHCEYCMSLEAFNQLLELLRPSITVSNVVKSQHPLVPSLVLQEKLLEKILHWNVERQVSFV